jgi:hypothetical protein
VRLPASRNKQAIGPKPVNPTPQMLDNTGPPTRPPQQPIFDSLRASYLLSGVMLQIIDEAPKLWRTLCTRANRRDAAEL